MTPTPKAQANEMAVEVIKEWRLTGNALVICISTALEKLMAENESAKKETEAAIRECVERGVERDKLLAENERLKGEVERSRWCAAVADSEKAGRVAAEKEARNLQSQLTATEARLETAKKELEEEKQTWQCEIHSEKLADNIVKEHYARGRVNGIEVAEQILSTLTAEKKEQG